MKLITRDTDYALRALVFIARRKKRIISASEMVRVLEIPRPFLRKILQTLNKESILKSYKGKGGGFKLALAPEKIFLLDLIKVFQGPLKMNECLFKKAPCPDVKSCGLKKKVEIIQKHAIKQLKNVSLASLMERGR